MLPMFMLPLMMLQTDRLWYTYGTEIYLYLLKKTSDPSVADDLRQNTFLKAHQSLSLVKDASKVKSWLFSIARNELMNYFQKTPKKQPLPESFHLETDRQLPTETPCCFEKFMNALPLGQKEAMDLIYSRGYSQKEAASHLQIPVSAVKSRIRKAKESLKKHFVSCCKYELNSDGVLKGESNCCQCEVN